MGSEEMMAATRAEPIVDRGGPVENTRGFVLHTGEYHLKNTIPLGPDIALSAQADIVSDIARGQGPRQLNFCLGYAGWAAGQLETELHTNSWLVVPADAHILFKTPAEERYMAATRKLGVDALNFSDEVGVA
jgi:putative transcriptional regulator